MMSFNLEKIDEIMRIAFYVFLIGTIASSIIPRIINRKEFAINSIIIWLLLFIILIVAYNYRHTITNSQVFAQLFPAKGILSEANKIIYKKAPDGHFYIDTIINGKELRFLVDTGASDVIISIEDANFLGFNLSELEFTKSYSTANGIVKAAPITINSLKLAGGKVVVQEVKAAITLGKQNGSLLGISFLERFNEYSFSGDDLTIIPIMDKASTQIR